MFVRVKVKIFIMIFAKKKGKGFRVERKFAYWWKFRLAKDGLEYWTVA